MAKRNSRRHSGLTSHRRERTKLISPWNDINKRIGGKANFSSWIDSRLPQLTWLALARASVAQDLFIANCHKLLDLIYEKREFFKDPLTSEPNHLNISIWDATIAELFVSEAVRLFGSNTFNPLLLLEDFPDKLVWSTQLSDPTEVDWNTLAKAIFETLDHQSQYSTDIRWFVLASAIVTGRLQAQRDWVETIKFYPKHGDQRSVRPSIRAAEMSMRKMMEQQGENSGQDLCESFWNTCFHKTPCFRLELKPNKKDKVVSCEPEKIGKIYSALLKHFLVKPNGSKLDAKFDSISGLSLYGTYLY